MASQSDDVVNVIFDYDDYAAVFYSDIAKARKEVVISSPYLSNAKIASLIQVLSAKIINNVIVTVVTKPSNEYNENKQQAVKKNIRWLLDVGVKIVESSNLHQRFAVVDQSVVWYGSVCLLGLSGRDDNLMRFDSSGIAQAILKQHFDENAYMATIQSQGVNYPGDVDAFIKTEVLPYAPDAWVDGSKTQIGYEISFTKHFYKPVQLRELSEIIADIRALEKETEGLLDEILGAQD
jgi:hypothetical protein